MADRHRLSVLLLGPASSVHTRRWASALESAGHQIVIASWQPGPALPRTQVRIAPAAGVSAALRGLLAAPWLRRVVAEARPDVIHVHSLGAHGLLSFALPQGPARVVTPWGSELRAARHSAVRAAVVRHALHRADLVLPTSAEVAAEVTNAYGIPAARTRILSWGVSADMIAARPLVSADAVRSSFGIPANATVALSVRATSATYRTLEIVSAFSLALVRRPDLFLVVLGGGRPDRQSARRARDGYLDQVRDAVRGIGDRALILDRILSPEQMFGLMSASDIAVSVPPADQRSSSVLEAALAGCRIVLSDIGPYREMISDGLTADLIAEPVGVALAGHLGSATADAASQRRNREFILAREHGAEKVAELERIYRQLAEHPHRQQ
jgi:glycosyltransferase involved in cell wall biosynthesis